MPARGGPVPLSPSHSVETGPALGKADTKPTRFLRATREVVDHHRRMRDSTTSCGYRIVRDIYQTPVIA